MFYLKIVMMIVCLSLWGCADSKPSQPDVRVSVSPSPSVAPKVVKVPSEADLKQASSYRQLGLKYRGQKRYTEALEALSKSVDLNPANVSGQVILGWTFHLAGQEEDAIKTLQEAVNLDENHVPAYNALGIVYLVSGNLDKAVETHQKAIQLQSDNEIAHYNLSLAYHRLKDYEQGIIHGKKAVTLEPDNPHPWVALALVYWDKGDKSLAKETYQKAINLDSRYRESWFLEHLKEAGFSEEQIQKVKELN